MSTAASCSNRKMRSAMTDRAVPSGLLTEAILDLDHPVKAATAEWARTLDPGDMVENDRGCRFFAAGWKLVAEHGVTGLLVPEALGGSGADPVTAALTLEGFGNGCIDNGLAYAVASQLVSFQEAVLRFGRPDQHEEILRAACAGDLLGAFAITEHESGSDTYAMATTAQQAGDGWVLHGTKAHITLAPVCDVAIVFAVTNPDAGRWGISAFIVRSGRPGVEFTETKPKMGLRTTPFGDIHLDGYEVQAADMLGAPGAGASIFATCMQTERSLIMATHLGAIERLIEQAVERANTRQQFGQPIAAFQAVSHRLVDMAMRHDAARLQIYKAAAALGQGGQSTLPAAAAKLAASEALAEIALDASRIHGALGYVESHEVEREVRDALGSLTYAGTSDVQKNMIAMLLGVATGG